VGPKTAERYVFYLLQKNPEELQRLAQLIAELKEKTVVCRSCHAVAETSPCAICSDTKRDKTILAVVSNTRDMLAIENTGLFRGYYHVLGGVINTIEGIEPEQLKVKQLIERLDRSPVNEVLLALNPTLEGETTAIYLAKLLKPKKLRVTRLARGLPTGADLEYADEMTITNALKYRNEI
jgi:recombination protein RecR